MASQYPKEDLSSKTASPKTCVSGPIWATLVRLSLPNMVVMLASALGAIIEMAYVGRLGTSALAGIAVVFPIVVLQQSLSNGAMGGGVSSAISRALGAKDNKRAQALAQHALVIGLIAGILFSCLMLAFGHSIFQFLGARDEALLEALSYGNVIFLGSLALWQTSILMSILRGCGDMRIPSQTLFVVLLMQAVISGCLGFGMGPLPQLGMAGIAYGHVIAFTGSFLFLLWYLVSGKSQIHISLTQVKFQKNLFSEILRVGLLSCISPLQTILTVLVTTGFVAYFGKDALAGYGIGARLEMVLVPIAFGIGVACVPIVGMAIGAGDISRARRTATYGGILAATIVGIIGVIVIIAPGIWADLFSSDFRVLNVAYSYLIWSGPAYGFFGLGLCLLFASQGAQKVMGPVLAGTVRLVVVTIGCLFLFHIKAEPKHFFMLVGIGMAIYGIFAAITVYRTSWHQPSTAQTLKA